MARHRNRRIKESLLDEAAFLGSGVGIAFSASQYAKMRKELSKKYTKNAWQATGKPFSRKAYGKWMDKYLKDINKLRTSPVTRHKGKAIFRDIEHFNPRFLSKDSRRLLRSVPKKKIRSVISMNKKTFLKIAPKRLALFSAGLATAATLPALAYRYQGKKDWKKSIKESTLQIAGPTLAVTGAYLGWKLKKYGKIKKII